MFIKFRPDVNVGGLDGAEHKLGHALALLVDQVGLEQSLARSESLSTDLTREMLEIIDCKVFVRSVCNSIVHH